jgi:hypothetical protein
MSVTCTRCPRQSRGPDGLRAKKRRTYDTLLTTTLPPSTNHSAIEAVIGHLWIFSFAARPPLYISMSLVSLVTCLVSGSHGFSPYPASVFPKGLFGGQGRFYAGGSDGARWKGPLVHRSCNFCHTVWRTEAWSGETRSASVSRGIKFHAGPNGASGFQLRVSARG